MATIVLEPSGRDECVSMMNEMPPKHDKALRYYQRFVLALVGLFFLSIVAEGALGQRGESLTKVHRAYSDVNGSLKTILGLWEVDCGRYPTTDEGLKALVNRPENVPPQRWRGPYIDSPTVPRDPWNHDYVYQFPGVHNTNTYDLYSLGPDGVSKTLGADPDDIANWEKPFHSEKIESEKKLSNFIERSLLIIPGLFMVRILVGFLWPRFQAVASASRWPDWVWFAMAMLIMIFMGVPQLARSAY